MNTHLSTKIYNFLVNAEEEHITGASVIYQGIEEDPWISKDELRNIISQAITLTNSQNVQGSSCHTTLLEILSEVSSYKILILDDEDADSDATKEEGIIV